MSLVDSSHVQPTRARHGAHYYMKPNPHGKLVPSMTMYPTTSDRKLCPECKKYTHKMDCGMFRDNAETCLNCGADLRGVEFETMETHK